MEISEKASGSTHVSMSRRYLALGLLAFMLVEGAAAIDQKYCSNQNTGTVFRGYARYQSTGLCHDACVEYAFAVVRGHDCWCADLVPNPSNKENDCNKGCPGINTEACGNSSSGSYGYIAVRDRKPKGTAGANDESIASTSPIESTTSKKSSTSSESPKTETPSPTAPWVSVITVDGPPVTVTFTPSGWVDPTTTAEPEEAKSGKGGFFSDAGRVAGVFTVIALLIIAMIGALLWIMRRRKQKGVPLGAEAAAPDKFGGVIIGAREKRTSRSMSTLGLTGAAFGSADKHPPIISTNSGSSGGTGGVNPAGTPERLVDQRLDPGQVWMRFENDNASRMSVRSLRDDQDYSRRVLRLANPDDD